jgi:hypothetical protein
MRVMAVNEDNTHESTRDYRSRPRWSAGKKMDAVLRWLRGEPLEVLSRDPWGGGAPAGGANSVCPIVSDCQALGEASAGGSDWT